MDYAAALTALFEGHAPALRALPDAVRRKWADIGAAHGLEPAALVHAWEAYALRERAAVRPASVDVLDAFARTLERTAAPARTPTREAKFSAVDLDGFLGGGGTPSSAPLVVSLRTADAPVVQRMQPLKDAMDIDSVEPSVAQSLNAHLPPHTERPPPLPAPHEHGRVVPYAHMWDEPRSVDKILRERIEVLGKELFDGEVRRMVPCASQEVVRYVGLVCALDDEGALTAHNAALYLPLGRPLRLRLDLIEQMTLDLFPGQVVAVAGVNPYGTRLIVQELSVPSALPPPLRSLSDLAAFSACIVAAAAPRTEFLLHALLGAALRCQATLLVLFGPFLSDDDTTAHETTHVALMRTLNAFSERARCRVVLVPSTSDALASVVFPQPPLPHTGEEGAEVHLVSNPSTLQMGNGLTLGLSAADVLTPLHRLSLTRTPADSAAPKRVRHFRHILQQHSYYPLYPPEADLALCMSQLAGATFPYTPDVVLVASAQPPSAHDVDGTLCVAPGLLSGGTGAATFAQIHVHRGEGSVASRTRVDILRLPTQTKQ